MTELSAVGEVINQLHQEICASAYGMRSKAIQVGELLTGQKNKLEHGEWLDWLEFNCPSIKERTASRYMAMFREQSAELSDIPEDKSANLTDASAIFEVLAGLFTIETEKEITLGDPGQEDSDEEGDDADAGAKHEGSNAQDKSGTGKDGGRVSVSPGAESNRPSPQDVIRAANQLEMSEKSISAGLKPFLEVTEALSLVKQNRLFEIGNFKSFEDYCNERWGFNWRLTKR